MYYIYVLKSIEYGNRYVGSTEFVQKRLKEHNNGGSRYTASRKPWVLIYQESLPTRTEAIKRELFLKSGQGRAYLDSLNLG